MKTGLENPLPFRRKYLKPKLILLYRIHLGFSVTPLNKKLPIQVKLYWQNGALGSN
jgi:hypothetical protein